MTTRTLPPRPLPSGSPSIASSLPGGRLQAFLAALAAWRRRRTAMRQARKADRELAALSLHLLRDIGARDASARRSGTLADAWPTARDLEIRG